MTTDNTKDEILEDDEPIIITLEFDDGVEVEAETMGVFEVDGNEYIALEPLDGSDDVLIFGYKDINDEDFELIDIEDEKEFERVVSVFDSIMTTGEQEE